MSLSRQLRMKELSARLGLGRSTIYKLIKQGDFPKPTKLTPNHSGWDEGKVETFVRSRQQDMKPPKD